MHTWDYRRIVLRQDEVAEFIRDTKGGKYSALLPLLGLHQVEVAAENLRQLAKSIEEQSKLDQSQLWWSKGTILHALSHKSSQGGRGKRAPLGHLAGAPGNS